MCYGMQLKMFLIKHQYDIWKVIGVMVITFLFLMRKIENVGEQEGIVQIDYLAIEDTEHPSADKFDEILAQILLILNDPELDAAWNSSSQSSAEVLSLFEQSCTADTELCEKAEFNGTFSDEEKYSYFEQFQFLVNEVDEYAIRGSTVREVLKQFIVNSFKSDRRGSAGRYKLTLNLGSMKYANEYFQVLTHEM